jgi:hypothetical protein
MNLAQRQQNIHSLDAVLTDLPTRQQPLLSSLQCTPYYSLNSTLHFASRTILHGQFYPHNLLAAAEHA